MTLSRSRAHGRERPACRLLLQRGATRTAAEAISQLLGCEIEEIIDTCPRRGPVGLLRTARDGILRRPAAIETAHNDPADYEPLIVGSPIWAGSMSCAVRTYLTRYGDRPAKVAFFVTMRLMGAESVLDEMAGLCACAPVARAAIRRREALKGSSSEMLKAFVEQIAASAHEPGP